MNLIAYINQILVFSLHTAIATLSINSAKYLRDESHPVNNIWTWTEKLEI